MNGRDGLIIGQCAPLLSDGAVPQTTWEFRLCCGWDAGGAGVAAGVSLTGDQIKYKAAALEPAGQQQDQGTPRPLLLDVFSFHQG